jgi:hypothetical protein
MKVGEIVKGTIPPVKKTYSFANALRKMEINDMIEISDFKHDNTVRQGIYRIQSLEKKMFTTRFNKERNILSVWRIK